MRTIKYKNFIEFLWLLCTEIPELANWMISEDEFVTMARRMGAPEEGIREFIELVSAGAYELEIQDEIKNATKILEL